MHRSARTSDGQERVWGKKYFCPKDNNLSDLVEAEPILCHASNGCKGCLFIAGPHSLDTQSYLCEAPLLLSQ